MTARPLPGKRYTYKGYPLCTRVLVQRGLQKYNRQLWSWRLRMEFCLCGELCAELTTHYAVTEADIIRAMLFVLLGILVVTFCFLRRATPPLPSGRRAGGSAAAHAAKLEAAGDACGAACWRKGAAGERRTASILSTELPHWSAAHDVLLPGSSANIDHYVCAPDGRAFVLDSKNWAPGYATLTALRKAAATVRWEAAMATKMFHVRATPVLVMHDAVYEGAPHVDGVDIVDSEELVPFLRRQEARVHTQAPGAR